VCYNKALYKFADLLYFTFADESLAYFNLTVTSAVNYDD